jgi:hypothetical protein
MPSLWGEGHSPKYENSLMYSMHHNLISPHVNPSPLQKESFGFYKKQGATVQCAWHFHKTKVETNHAYHFWLMEVYPAMTLSNSSLEHAENIKPNYEKTTSLGHSFLGAVG